MIDNHGKQLWLAILFEIIGTTEDKHFLDLCCGEMTNTKEFKFTSHLGVDILDWPNRPKHIEFEQADLRIWPGPKHHYDIVLCADGIEHFTKEEGSKLIRNMESWGALPIIFTPIGFFKLGDPKTPMEHKSGWEPGEFKKQGWETKEFPLWHSTLNLGAFFAWKPLLT